MSHYPQLPVESVQPTMIVHNVLPVNVGPNRTQVTCPSCHGIVVTRVSHESTTKTHLMALLCCCLTCCVCAILPYCMSSCKNANHSCPNCGAFIGTYES